MVDSSFIMNKRCINDNRKCRHLEMELAYAPHLETDISVYVCKSEENTCGGCCRDMVMQAPADAKPRKVKEWEKEAEKEFGGKIIEVAEPAMHICRSLGCLAEGVVECAGCNELFCHNHFIENSDDDKVCWDCDQLEGE